MNAGVRSANPTIWAVTAFVVACGGTVSTTTSTGAAGSTSTAGSAGMTLDAGKDSSDSSDASLCTTPNPAGCFNNGGGCRLGQVCTSAGCASSSCTCSSGRWVCTQDCGGGICVQALCGGSEGLECSSADYCYYGQSGAPGCGGGVATGVCVSRPSACPSDCPGVCGCDGKFYCNQCIANLGATDVSGSKECVIPDGGPAEASVCLDQEETLAGKFNSIQECTTAVRLSYENLALLAYQIVCGPKNQLDEGQARSIAQAKTGFGSHAISLSQPSPTDEFVFLVSPGDFGGAAAVSARSGLAVFGGSTVWAGEGEVNWPPNWPSPSELGDNCPSGIPLPPVRFFDLTSGGAGVDASAAQAPVSRVWATVLPAAIQHVHYTDDIVVLLYPRTVGPFRPTTAEWIVLVNSGW